MSERQRDPWTDVPRWSEDDRSAAADEAPAAALVPRDEAPASAEQLATEAAPADPGPRACAWCATPAGDDATHCPSCGAALAQRESIGDLVIPGLTAVDPALKDLENRPLHLSGPSPSHGVASGLIVAAAAGGPVGLAILGGVGAVAAAEYLGASRDKPGGPGHDNVGEPSAVVLQAIERLERGEPLPSAADPTPQPGVEPPSAQSPDTTEATEGTVDGQR